MPGDTDRTNKKAKKIWNANPTDKVLEMLESDAKVEDILAELEKDEPIEAAAERALNKIQHCLTCDEDVEADMWAMHVISGKHQASMQQPTIIDKNADDLFDNKEQRADQAQGKRGSLTLSEVMSGEATLNMMVRGTAGQKEEQTLRKHPDLEVPELVEDIDQDEMESMIEDMENKGENVPCIANAQGGPLPEKEKGNATSTAAEDVVKSGEEESTEPAVVAETTEERIPDGYVREDGKIYCPIMKKRQERWYVTRVWVTKEHFEELARLGKLPVGEHQDLVKLVEGKLGKDKGGLGKDEAKLEVTQANLGKDKGGLVKLEGGTPAIVEKITQEKLSHVYQSEWQKEKYQKALEVLDGARFLPGSGPLMMMLAERAVYLYGRLQEYQQIKSMMDVPLWVEYRYTQQLLNTIDRIFKMSGLVARTKGMTEVTIKALVKVINETVQDRDTKLKLIEGMQKIAQAAHKGAAD